MENSFYLDTEQDYYNQQYEWNKSIQSSYKKKLTFQQVIQEFENSILMRITFPYDNRDIDVKDFRHIPNIVQAFEKMKSFRPSSKYQKHTFTFMKEIITDEMYYWKTTDWCHSKIKNDYVLGKGFSYIDLFIEKYLLTTAKNITNKENKTSNDPTHSNDVKTPKIDVFEPENETIKDESNKKTKKEKPIFHPNHKLVIKDGKVLLESIIMAIADLVWREPNKRDLYYIDKLDLSGLTEQQIKYVKAVFYTNQYNHKVDVLENNPYWTIEKSGKNNILIPIRKREGYYYIHKDTGLPNFVSLTTVSSKLKMAKNTVIYRLSKMTLQDLVKMK